VLGWRLVNFWLPIPIGAASYSSLRLGRGAGLRDRRRALSTMFQEAQGPDPMFVPQSSIVMPLRIDAPLASNVEEADTDQGEELDPTPGVDGTDEVIGGLDGGNTRPSE
jgi:hypothetical protein